MMMLWDKMARGLDFADLQFIYQVKTLTKSIGGSSGTNVR